MLTNWKNAGSKVFLYSKRKDEAGIRLQRVVEAFVPGMNLEIYRDVKDLTLRLSQPGNPVDISILMTGSKKELSEFIGIRELLSDIRIIIVLPDRTKGTIATGHSFRPRFITYADSDFVEVGAVLNRMMDHVCKNN